MANSPDRVEIARDLSSLIPFFLQNRRERIQQALHCCAVDDMACLRRMGHDFKGTCGGYGFHHLSALGALLEDCADTDSARQVLERMQRHLENLELVFV